MNLTNTFEVPVPPEEAFALLLDIARVVPCLPGAELVAVEGDAYRCKAALRLGPLALTFRGTATVVEADAGRREARIALHGADEKGRGGADADVTFRLEPTAHGTKVEVQSAITLTGSIAQYGRGGGIVGAVAGDLTRQFAKRLERALSS